MPTAMSMLPLGELPELPVPVTEIVASAFMVMFLPVVMVILPPLPPDTVLSARMALLGPISRSRLTWIVIGEALSLPDRSSASIWPPPIAGGVTSGVGVSRIRSQLGLGVAGATHMFSVIPASDALLASMRPVPVTCRVSSRL